MPKSLILFLLLRENITGKYSDARLVKDTVGKTKNILNMVIFFLKATVRMLNACLSHNQIFRCGHFCKWTYLTTTNIIDYLNLPDDLSR